MWFPRLFCFATRYVFKHLRRDVLANPSTPESIYFSAHRRVAPLAVGCAGGEIAQRESRLRTLQPKEQHE